MLRPRNAFLGGIAANGNFPVLFALLSLASLHSDYLKGGLAYGLEISRGKDHSGRSE